VQGKKTIGTDSEENPVYKYSATSTSDASGHINLSDMEWDNYSFHVSPNSGLDLIDIDPSPQPISLLPDNVTLSVSLYLEAENSLLINIQNNETLEPIFLSSVRLYSGGLGYDTTQYTNERGQTYFVPLDIATYNLDVQASGHTSASTQIVISGDHIKTIKIEQVE